MYRRSDEMDIQSPYVLVAYNPLHTHEIGGDQHESIYIASKIRGNNGNYD
jgi:hypothetical protein